MGLYHIIQADYQSLLLCCPFLQPHWIVPGHLIFWFIVSLISWLKRKSEVKHSYEIVLSGDSSEAIPNSDLLNIEGAGHVLIVTRTKEVVDAIE